MKYIKDLFNLKENKGYKIMIIILLIIIIFMQTGLSFKNNKIRILTENTKKLSEQIKANEVANSNNEINSIDDLIESEDPKEYSNEYEVKKSDLINRYKKIAAEESKVYDANIKEGKKYLVFETVYLEMTDNQIKETLKNIVNNEFGIDISENKIGSGQFFKIYLIEKN